MKEVKICPCCELENLPTTLRCSCGNLLANVDITGPRSAEALHSGLKISDTENTTYSGCCPFSDCGASNPDPKGRGFCNYCNRDMNKAEAAPSTIPFSSAIISWPWGEDSVLAGELRIGREPPAPARLASMLERDYVNVSRRHAEFIFSDNTLILRDLGSTNGTFVNDKRIETNQMVTLANGDQVRFAAHLTTTITLK